MLLERCSIYVLCYFGTMLNICGVPVSKDFGMFTAVCNINYGF